jgi:RimJ/RimL family protein N-acetyltransferase
VTERLVLRAHRPDDFEASFAMWADPGVVRFIGGVPSTETQAWSRLLVYAGLWSLLGYGYWAIEERDGGAFAGEAGLADFRREIDPAMRGVPEAGWVLATRAHGKGYATEAVQAILNWADATLAADRTCALIAPENAASIRVALKCGYRELNTGTFAGQPCTFFERNR